MIEIKKTYKNYVGGKYVRSESGKTFTLSLLMFFAVITFTVLLIMFRVINYNAIKNRKFSDLFKERKFG